MMRRPFLITLLGSSWAMQALAVQRKSLADPMHLGVEQSLVDSMMDRQMDGVILIGPRLTRQAIDSLAHRIPLTMIAHHKPSAESYDTVNDDDVHGAELVVQHLIAGGYRNIAMLSLDPLTEDASQVTEQREIGYRRAMEQAGLKRYIKVLWAAQRPRDILPVVTQLLQSRGRPEAIFCWTDFIALEVLSAARELGLSVPGDLAVVGYDNTSWCDLAQNALTSIDQSGQVIGLQAARLLIERIQGRQQAEHFVVTPRLVARASSAAKKK